MYDQQQLLDVGDDQDDGADTGILTEFLPLWDGEFFFTNFADNSINFFEILLMAGKSQKKKNVWFGADLNDSRDPGILNRTCTILGSAQL